MPFKRITFAAFKLAVEKAEVTDGSQGFVTINALSAELTSQSWKELGRNGSDLCKILLSPVLQNLSRYSEAEHEGKIDKDFLLLFGLLHCIDKKKPMAKANGLYELL